jgi:hypothetical protein
MALHKHAEQQKNETLEENEKWVVKKMAKKREK